MFILSFTFFGLKAKKEKKKAKKDKKDNKKGKFVAPVRRPFDRDKDVLETRVKPGGMKQHKAASVALQSRFSSGGSKYL